MSSSSSQTNSSKKIDELILDCYMKSADILLPGRNAYMIAMRDTSDRVVDTADYYKHVIQRWANNITQPLMIDLSFIDPTTQTHVLFEKWVFYYQRRDSTQESRLNVTNLKIVTFLRALYSTVRLLPGFQLLFATRSMTAVSYRIYNPEISDQSKFSGDYIVYDFSRINTSKGILNASVRYIEAINLQVSQYTLYTYYSARKSKYFSNFHYFMLIFYT
jgi:Autophagy-related protein 13